MDDRAARVFTGLCVLVLMWIGVYWFWQPGTPAMSFASGGGNETRQAQPRPQNTDTMTQDQQRRPAPAPAIEPPEFRQYVVRDGDTFERIAERELGDAALWTVVARANPLKDPRRLRDGVVLRLPLDPGNVQGRVVERAPRPGDRPASPEPATPTYVVRSGDTLSGISQAHYGTSVHARLIYEANTDSLRSMHSLSVGQPLRLPPAPSDD